MLPLLFEGPSRAVKGWHGLDGSGWLPLALAATGAVNCSRLLCDGGTGVVAVVARTGPTLSAMP